MTEIDGKSNTENAEKMVGEKDEKMMKDNEKMVSSHTPNRQSPGGITHLPNGKFAPANAANPLGRPKRADERAIIAAMDKALPPDKLSQAIQDALDWAYEYKSWKAILAISQFVVAYQIGQPVQRSVSASGKLESILSRLSSMDENEFDAVERAIRIPVDTENE